jgi:ubiquinol-cytochrome c reductase cytochrome b subunit
MLMFALFVFYLPDALGHPDNYTPANPLKTPPHIVPEWYLLPFYAILRAIDFAVGPISAKLGGLILMVGAIAVLFVLPWLDTSKVRSMRYRPIARIFFLVFVVVCLALGWCGAQSPDLLVGGVLKVTQVAQILTAYYFAFFLIILPLLGLRETPDRVPETIAKAIGEKTKKSTAAAAPDREA